MNDKALKIMCIFGTRPEATKMAPVITELNRRGSFKTVVCVTAQHRDMLDQALEVFSIRPDYDMNIMKPGQKVTDVVTGALTGLTEIISKELPDMVLVHGDTSTTFAGALASFYCKVKLGHVEAGLRTFNKYQPYPEEMNRLLTTDLADVHFAPTLTAKRNLLKENVDESGIFVTGNTAVDCLKTTVLSNYRFHEEALNKIDYSGKRIIAMTAHRRENLGEALDNICRAAGKIVQRHEDVELVYAVHKNPSVSNVAHRILGGQPRVHLVDPLNMNDMHNLINKSYMVMTDSGGLQEEAPGLDKPVLVLRNVTERPEGLEAGTLKLCGTDFQSIVESAGRLLDDSGEYEKMSRAVNPFGDGYAAERIADAILYVFGRLQDRPRDFGDV